MSKVLVVDDSDSWCSAVALELGKAGYSVIRARHHDEALTAAADEKPSLVMVDLLVAAKAGAGFVRKMRSLPAMKDSLMLLATAGTDRMVVHKALGIGADQIITKNRCALDHLSQQLTRVPVSA